MRYVNLLVTLGLLAGCGHERGTLYPSDFDVVYFGEDTPTIRERVVIEEVASAMVNRRYECHAVAVRYVRLKGGKRDGPIIVHARADSMRLPAGIPWCDRLAEPGQCGENDNVEFIVLRNAINEVNRILKVYLRNNGLNEIDFVEPSFVPTGFITPGDRWNRFECWYDSGTKKQRREVDSWPKQNFFAPYPLPPALDWSPACGAEKPCPQQKVEGTRADDRLWCRGGFLYTLYVSKVKSELRFIDRPDHRREAVDRWAGQKALMSEMVAVAQQESIQFRGKPGYWREHQLIRVCWEDGQLKPEEPMGWDEIKRQKRVAW